MGVESQDIVAEHQVQTAHRMYISWLKRLTLQPPFPLTPLFTPFPLFQPRLLFCSLPHLSSIFTP